MRRDDPIHWQPGLDGTTRIWFVTRYADVAAIATMLLDPLVGRGEADLSDAFASPLPTIVIVEMLGVPAEDRGRFRAWANALPEPPMTPEAQVESTRLLTEFTNYLCGLFAERRALPTRLPRLRLSVPREDLRYRFLPGFRALRALPVRWGPER